MLIALQTCISHVVYICLREQQTSRMDGLLCQHPRTRPAPNPPPKKERSVSGAANTTYTALIHHFGHERGARGSPWAMLSQDRATASRKFLLNTSPAFLMTFLVPERQNIFNIIEIKLPCALKISLTPPFLLADGGLMWYTSVAMYATHLM